MKLTEQIVVEELAKVGYGGTQAQRAAAAIMERAKLSAVELANAVDDFELMVRYRYTPAEQVALEQLVRRLAQ
jgi:ATP-dependent protease HslVU (ClpYQ) peptidase subunit